MDSRRIYGTIQDINADNVREFFDNRARLLNQSKGEDKNSRYAAVTFSGKKAVEWDVLEKGLILPLLNIRESDSVLDIGCGVGRWAESVIPLCGRYVGTDYSQEMVMACKEKFSGAEYEGNDVSFLNLSFQEVLNSDRFNEAPFDVVLIAGVAMYINDDDLQKGFKQLVHLFAPGGRMYLWESIGLGKRLTLDGVWSSALNSNYSAVYRTREEYLDLLHPIISISDVVDEQMVNVFDHESNTDTSRWFVVLKNR